MLSLSRIRASLPLQVLTEHVGTLSSPDKPACAPSCSETTALSLQVVCVQVDSPGHTQMEAAATYNQWRVLLMAGNNEEAEQHDHHSMDIKDRVMGQNQPQVCLLSSNSCLVIRQQGEGPERTVAQLQSCNAAQLLVRGHVTCTAALM